MIVFYAIPAVAICLDILINGVGRELECFALGALLGNIVFEIFR